MKIKVFNDNINKSFSERSGGNRLFYPLDFTEVLRSPKNDKVLIEMFGSVPELYAPLDYIATQFAALDFKFVKRQTNGKEKDISLPEYETLIANPNPYQNNSAFLKLACIQYHLQGDVYINLFKGIGINKPSYLFLLPPQYTTPVFERMQYNKIDPNADFRVNKVIAYQLKYGNSLSKTIDAVDIIHLKDSNTEFDNGEYAKGSSCAYRAIMATKAIKAGYEAKYSFYKNRGALGLFVNNDPDGLQPDTKEKQRVLDSFKNNFGLKEGQSLFEFYDHNVNYINIAPDFSGLQINQNNEADFRAICKAIKGFPPSLLMDNRIALLRDSKEADRRLYKNIVLPFAYNFCEKISIGLGLSKENIWYVPDLSKIEALQEDLDKKETVLTKKQSRLIILYNEGLITGDYLLEQVGIPTSGFGLKEITNGE